MSLAALTAALAAAGCVAAAEEAEELIAFAPEGQLRSLLERRVRGEPLAWIVGSVEFCGCRVLVSPGVYVPRWQTEPLVERAASLLEAGGTAVDLCTGSGAIPVALARLAPRARVLATELDPVAVACARSNGVEVFEGDLDRPLPPGLEGAVDVVTAVVPYVPSDEIRLLPSDVRDFEPRSALDGGATGTAVLERAVSSASRLLRGGGTLLLELGGEEADLLEPVAVACGFGPLLRHLDEDGDLRSIEAARLA